MITQPRVLEDIDTHIWGCPPPMVMQYAEQIMPLLRKVATPDTGHTPESVMGDILHGQIALWVIGDFTAITCTSFQDRPTGRVLWNNWIAGENMDDWLLDWLRVQETYAVAGQCTAIEFAGRRGYMRKYMPHYDNFKAVRTIYRKEI